MPQHWYGRTGDENLTQVTNNEFRPMV